MRLRHAIACLLLVALVPAGFGQDQKRLQRMQAEKLRIMRVRAELAAKKDVSSLLVLQEVYRNIARGNEKQYADNKRLVGKLREYAVVADRKRMFEKRDAYLKLAAIYKYYAEQNQRIVKAYAKFNSAEITKALAEIDKIEKKIVSMGFKPVKRDWFTVEELNKVPLPGQEPKEDADNTKTKNS